MQLTTPYKFISWHNSKAVPFYYKEYIYTYFQNSILNLIYQG